MAIPETSLLYERVCSQVPCPCNNVQLKDIKLTGGVQLRVFLEVGSSGTGNNSALASLDNLEAATAELVPVPELRLSGLHAPLVRYLLECPYGIAHKNHDQDYFKRKNHQAGFKEPRHIKEPVIETMRHGPSEKKYCR